MSNPESTAAPSLPRSRLGRRFAAATMTVLTGLFIWFGGSTLQRAVYGWRPPNPVDHDCRGGIRRLHGAYEEAWTQARAGGDDASTLAQLDADLHGLRGLCAREGDGSAEAFEHLERWRYRAEDQVRLWRESVGDEAGRALGQSGNLR